MNPDDKTPAQAEDQTADQIETEARAAQEVCNKIRDRVVAKHPGYKALGLLAANGDLPRCFVLMMKEEDVAAHIDTMYAMRFTDSKPTDEVAEKLSEAEILVSMEPKDETGEAQVLRIPAKLLSLLDDTSSSIGRYLSLSVMKRRMEPAAAPEPVAGEQPPIAPDADEPPETKLVS